MLRKLWTVGGIWQAVKRHWRWYALAAIVGAFGIIAGVVSQRLGAPPTARRNLPPNPPTEAHERQREEAARARRREEAAREEWAREVVREKAAREEAARVRQREEAALPQLYRGGVGRKGLGSEETAREKVAREELASAQRREELAREKLACFEKLRKLGVVLQKGPCVDIGGIVANLRSGTYHFKKPEVGWVRQSFPFALILQTAKGQEKEIAEALRSIPGVEAGREAKFARNLEATLSGPDLNVVPAGPVPRIATTAEPVEWDWTVTPQTKGTKRLTIEVVANIVVGSTKTHVQLKVFHEDIKIKIGFIQWVRASLTELNALTASLLALLTTLGSIFAFVRPARQWLIGLFRRRV